MDLRDPTHENTIHLHFSCEALVAPSSPRQGKQPKEMRMTPLRSLWIRTLAITTAVAAGACAQPDDSSDATAGGAAITEQSLPHMHAVDACVATAQKKLAVDATDRGAMSDELDCLTRADDGVPQLASARASFDAWRENGTAYCAVLGDASEEGGTILQAMKLSCLAFNERVLADLIDQFAQDFAGVIGRPMPKMDVGKGTDIDKEMLEVVDRLVAKGATADDAKSRIEGAETALTKAGNAACMGIRHGSCEPDIASAILAITEQWVEPR
jgi:hypothetical protein